MRQVLKIKAISHEYYDNIYIGYSAKVLDKDTDEVLKSLPFILSYVDEKWHMVPLAAIKQYVAHVFPGVEIDIDPSINLDNYKDLTPYKDVLESWIKDVDERCKDKMTELDAAIAVRLSYDQTRPLALELVRLQELAWTLEHVLHKMY